MFLSVIVPVYNVEKYLSKSLTSLLIEMELQFEIILVIGKSSDKSNEICSQFQGDNKNIKLIYQNGTGLSNARNCGLKEACGDYVIFVDSDDYIIGEKAKEFFKELYGTVNNISVDIVINDFYMVNQKGNLLYTQNQIKTDGNEFKGYNYCKDFLAQRGSVWNVWRFVFKRTFLMEHYLIFKENSLCEDLEFSIKSILKTQKIIFFHQPYYCYRGNRLDSLFNSQNEQYAVDLIAIIEELLNMINNCEGFLFKDILIDKLLSELLLSSASLFSVPKKDRSKVKELYKLKYYLFNNSRSCIMRGVRNWIKYFGITNIAFLLYIIKKLRRKIIYKNN